MYKRYYCFAATKIIVFAALNALFSSCSLIPSLLITGTKAALTHGAIAYTKGQKTRYKNTDAPNDSVLAFGINDSLPASAVFIANSKIKSPTIYKIREPNATSIGQSLTYAKYEALRSHANAVKIVRQAPMHKRLYVKLYALPQPSYAAYIHTTDSINTIQQEKNKDYCLVHIKSTFGMPKMPVYFDDSLATTIPRMTFGINPYFVMAVCPAGVLLEIFRIKKWEARKRKILQKGNIIYHPADFEFNTSGIIKISKEQTSDYNTFYAEKGHEYYYYIVYSSFVPYLRRVSAEEYRLNELLY